MTPDTIAWGLLLVSPLLLGILSFVDAPYGKREVDGWGPAVPIRLAWLLLEVPSFALPLWVLWQHGTLPGAPASILLCLWLAHYFHRSFVYPLTLRPRPGAGFKVVVLLLGMGGNAAIGWMLATSFVQTPHLQSASWLLNPRFVVGVALCLAGLAITKWADARLRALRAPGDSSYYIPRGGLYERVSCPNYFGEILQWFGFALAAWTLSTLAFAVYTATNLVPRALSSHRWYREQFPDYPTARRALLPGVL